MKHGEKSADTGSLFAEKARNRVQIKEYIVENIYVENI